MSKLDWIFVLIVFALAIGALLGQAPDVVNTIERVQNAPR